MRRITIAVFACVLAVAACGDDDATPASAESSSATTSAPAETTTTAAPTTSAAPAVSGPDGFIANSLDAVGQYEGQWDNATFGSSGALYLDVQEASTQFRNLVIEVDADGNAFGAADPDPFVVEIWVEDDGFHVGADGFLGDATFDADEAGNFTMSAQPPLLGGMTLEIVGGITAEGFGGTYEIPGLADGTWSAAPTG